MRFLLLITLISIPFTQLRAQDSDVDQRVINIKDLVVSTEKPGAFRPLVRVISVIEAKEIERAAISSLPDLLRYVQGVDFKARGAEGVQADINILGGTFDQTIIMINGVNFTDPQTGHHSMNIPLDISQIERVEVLQGPGAWAGGAIAFAGAINFVTKESDKQGASLFMTGGSYGYFKAGGDVSTVREKGRWIIRGYAGGGYSRSDGYADNTDFETGNLYSNIKISDKEGKNSFFIQNGLILKSFGANNFYSFTYPEQYEKIDAGFTSFQYSYVSDKFILSSNIYHRRLYDKFELFRYDSPSWYTGHNYHRNDITGGGVEAGFRLGKAGTVTTGMDFRTEYIMSTVLGNPTSKKVEIRDVDDLYYTKSKGRYTPSIFLKYILQSEKWKVSAGATLTNSFNEPGVKGPYGAGLYGGVAGAYNITPYLEANVWITSTFRNPTFTDLYYKSPTQTGNSSLLPEKATTYQTGLRYSDNSVKASISYFYRRGYKIIDWIRESSNDQWSAANITDVNSSGAEFSAEKRFRTGFVERASISYGWLNVKKSSGNYHSLYATDFLKHKLSASLNHKIYNSLEAGWTLLYQEREGTYLDLSLNEKEYKPFTLLNVKILWKRSSYSIFTEITNLTDKKYFDLGNLTQPGRWIKGGIVINL